MASVVAAAMLMVSCSGDADEEDLSNHPILVVQNLGIIQHNNQVLQFRAEAERMERYDKDTMVLELYPQGVEVYSYDASGKLETILLSDEARHETASRGDERWKVNGDVVIQNVIKRQTMETDTLYWYKTKQLIWTDCYVKMYSEDGFLQGYGIESSQKTNTSLIKHPFDSYGYTKHSGQRIAVDSANFIGPAR